MPIANWLKNLFSRRTETDNSRQQSLNGNVTNGVVNFGDNAVINNGITDATVQKIIAVFESQHKTDADYIKQLNQTIEDLRSGKVDAPPAAIQAAFAALEKGDASLAESLFEKSVDEELKKAADSNKNAAKAFRNLGTLRWWDTQKALAAYQQATKLDSNNADGWNQLGQLFERVGELDQAIAAYQIVLKLGQVHQDQEKIAWAYGNLGIVYQTRGELDKAVEMFQKSLAISESLGMKKTSANQYGNLGSVYSRRGELDKAVEIFQKILKIHEELGNKEGLAADYGNLGGVYFRRSELDKAFEMYNKALAITQELGNKEGMANHYSGLGIVYPARGELDKAVEMLSKALAIDEQMGKKKGMAEDCANLGLVYKLKGNKAEAKRYWQKSIELYKYIGSPMAKKVQGWLDDLK
jgi:tetratricopeptide (TPR) repeat protein